jgi:hypothetical protein
MRHCLAICCFLLFFKPPTTTPSIKTKSLSRKEHQSSILASLAFYLQTSTLKILPTPLMHSRESCSQKLKERKQNDRQSFEIGVQAM